MIKSASSFVFQIIDDATRLYAKNVGGEFYLVEDAVDQDLNSSFVPVDVDIDSIVRQLIKRKGAGPSHSTTIKTHEACTPYLRTLIESGVVLSNASFRHPADVALSLIDSSIKDRANGTSHFSVVNDPGEALPHVMESVQQLMTWVTDKTLLTPFDDIAFKTPDVVARLEAQIGVRLPDDYLQQRFPHKAGISQFNKGVKDRRLEDMSEQWRDHYDLVFADFIGLFEALKKT